MRRVVVTGIGIYSCIGKNIHEVTESLKVGKSGIGIDPARTSYGYHTPLVGIVESPNLKPLLERRFRSYLSEEGEYAFVATLEAMKMAGVDEDYCCENEVGIIYGNETSAKSLVDCSHIMEKEKDTMMLGSGLIFQVLNSTITMNLSTIFKIRGVNMTVSSACASGAQAIGLGLMYIRGGLQDIVICGGAQETNFYSTSCFDALGALSLNSAEPTKASKPFDKSRDGLVPSGGGATVILEEYEHAVKRGATILAEIVGYGFSSNGTDISKPDVKGSVIAVQRALNDAHLMPSDVDYINAHATATPIGDSVEAEVINEIFGKSFTPVSSTKSMTGHELWMAGASEVVYSILMMRNSFIAPNINFETPDEHSLKINIVTQTIHRDLNVILSNSFGFGGTNCVLIIKNIDHE